MARITVPLNEAIHVFRANVDLGNFIKRIDATPHGPKLIVAFPPLLRETAILIRFQRFEGGAAYFALDGAPAFLNLNTMLRLPQGITSSGSMLKIQPDVLMRTQLNLRGISVSNVAWSNGAFVIDTSVY
jgi:hypothetical protein